MQYVIAALIYIVSISAVADPCERSESDRDNLHTITYKPVVKEPGEKIKVGGDTYVLVRYPFKEWESGKRYAITMPVRQFINDSASSSRIYSRYFNTGHMRGDECSDVWIEGTAQSSHKIQVSESRSVRHEEEIYYGERPERSGAEFYVYRGLSVFADFQIGETRGSVRFSMGRYEIPEKDINPGDYDLTNNINWNRLTHDRNPLFSRLQTLIRHVYITPLED